MSGRAAGRLRRQGFAASSRTRIDEFGRHVVALPRSRIYDFDPIERRFGRVAGERKIRIPVLILSIEPQAFRRQDSFAQQGTRSTSKLGRRALKLGITFQTLHDGELAGGRDGRSASKALDLLCTAPQTSHKTVS